MKHRSLILIVAGLLLVGPWFAPKFLLGYSGDYLFILGATLGIGLFSASFLPTTFLAAFGKSLERLLHRQTMLLTLLAIALLAALISTNQFVLLRFMNSGDEHSCFFLAECIRGGKWWAVPHALSEFFDVAHVGNREGKWFSVYPPGWPLLLALGISYQIADFLNPIMATLATLLFVKSGARLFGFHVSFFGMLLIAFTPFYLLNNASYFSHTTCLLMISLFIFSFLKWQENEKSFVWGAICALTFGFGLATRYLTMTAIATPFLLYELIALIRGRRSLTPSHLLALGIALAGVLANLAYNQLITGSMMEFPNHFHHSWERLGFHSNHTLLDALNFMFSRFLFLSEFIPPILVVVFFAALFMNRMPQGIPQLIRFGFLFLPVGYLFYYSWGGNQYGPRYYFEGLPFLALTVGNMIHHSWKSRNETIKKFIVGAVVAAFLANGYSLWKYGNFFHHVSLERKSLYDFSERTLQRPSIVFIRGFLGDTLVMAEEDAVRNHPDLKAQVLYAHDRGAENELLKQHYPEREYYLGVYDRANKTPRLERLGTPS
jgi:hypothetical protein